MSNVRLVAEVAYLACGIRGLISDKGADWRHANAAHVMDRDDSSLPMKMVKCFVIGASSVPIHAIYGGEAFVEDGKLIGKAVKTWWNERKAKKAALRPVPDPEPSPAV